MKPLTFYKRKYAYKYHTIGAKIKWWILANIIKDELIEEYAQDKELLRDYYLSEPDYEDYRHDYY